MKLVRAELWRRLNERLVILPLCGAVGDQSPRVLLYARQEAEMRKRRGRAERQEIAERVADAVELALAYAKPQTSNIPVKLRARRLGLTCIKISREQRDWADAARRDMIQSGNDRGGWWPVRVQRVVDTFDRRKELGPF